MGTLGCINDMLQRDKENRELRKRNRERLTDTYHRLLLNYIFAVPGYVYISAVTGTGKTKIAFIFQSHLHLVKTTAESDVTMTFHSYSS